MSLPTLQTLQDPILLQLASAFKASKPLLAAPTPARDKGAFETGERASDLALEGGR
jgi:hypothetical protein